MNASDLTILSYKELQALASKHRVPGNIKKSLLVKILQAKSCGNNSEVSKLLTDLKKNRKKRTKRLKIMKPDDDVSLHMALCSDSPDLSSHQDHYLFPITQQQQQHQHPFQWVGAEEEVATSKYEDIKCNLSYNDLRQFVFYTTQGVYSNCDTNNNSTLLDEIVDLRTENTVSNCRSTLDAININGTIQQQAVQQPTEESASTKMSLLLKKMLQAPVGADLGEIASPVSTWPVVTYRMREPSPDNSETMTARSDINENDEIWQDSVTQTPTTDLPYVFENETSYNDNPYYRRTDGNSYYRSLDNGMETLNYDQPYYLTFSPQADAQENCRSWLASNSLNMTSSTDYGLSPTPQLAPVTPFQYQNPETLDMINPNPASSSNIIQSNTNQQYYNADHLYTGQSSLMLDSSDIVSDTHFDSSRFYSTPTEFTRPQESQDYYNQINTSSYSHDFYDSHPTQQQQQQQQSSNQSTCSDYAQQLATAPIYQIDLDNSNAIVPYDSGYYQEQQPQQPSNQPVASVADPLQQVQNQQYESYVSTATATPVSAPAPAPATSLNNPTPAYGSGVLDPYWPRWSLSDQNTIASQTGGRALENTLNLCSSNYVDYTKLNETCCVYSNRTPVMTLRKGFNSVPANFETQTSSAGFTGTEYRYHNFNSNGLLYDSPNADVQRSLTPVSSSNLDGYSLIDQEPEIII